MTPHDIVSGMMTTLLFGHDKYEMTPEQAVKAFQEAFNNRYPEKAINFRVVDLLAIEINALTMEGFTTEEAKQILNKRLEPVLKR